MKIYNITFSDINDFLLKVEPPKDFVRKLSVQMSGHELTLSPYLNKDLKPEWRIIEIS